MASQQNIIVYYGEYMKSQIQENCYIFRINCLLDNGIYPWVIDNDENILTDNGIITSYAPVKMTNYSIIQCEPDKMNIDDFYTYSEAKGNDILMWRTFTIIYDNGMQQPIFGKYSNIDELDEMFEYIINGALSRINI